MSDLADMARLISQIMINSSAALLQADRVLARVAIARSAEIDAQYHETKQRCRTLLGLYAPSARDQQAIVTALHIADGLQRMSHLAQRIAKTAHPLPHEIRTPIAQMSLLASGLAHQAAATIQKPDPLAGNRLTPANNEVGALHRQLSRSAFPTWSHGTEPGIDAALLGHYYKCFADYAMMVTKQASSLATRTNSTITAAPGESTGIRQAPTATHAPQAS